MFGPRWVPALGSCSEAIPEDLAEWGGERPGSGHDHVRVAADHVGRVVVHVLVSHEDDIRLDALQARVVELDRPILRKLAVRVDRDGVLPPAEQEGSRVPAI